MLPSMSKKFRREYETLNTIEISSSNFRRNYQYLNNIKKAVTIAPVLKSNAYGHGIGNVAKILKNFNPPFFCVDSLYEAQQLINVGIRSQILVMGYVHPSQITRMQPWISWGVWDINYIKILLKRQKNINIHLFVDTGMNREGIEINKLDAFIQELKKMSGVTIEGLMSHLAMADKPYHPLTINQLNNFDTAQNILDSNGIIPKWIHIAASAGLLNAHQLAPHKIGNLARVGLALYGMDPRGKRTPLRNTIELKTTLVQIKQIKKNEKAGYDFTYRAKKDTTIGILPLGYNDGVDRRLSNTGYISIKGHMCTIVGRVSMNITTIDLSNVPNAKVGDEVIVYSGNKAVKNSWEKSAEFTDTISYEFLVHLHPSIRRVII